MNWKESFKEYEPIPLSGLIEIARVADANMKKDNYFLGLFLYCTCEILERTKLSCMAEVLKNQVELVGKIIWYDEFYCR